MNSRTVTALLAATVVSSLVSADERPDIVLMMADDLGFSDIGCYGSEIPTPNLDELAASGVRFTNFYNTCRCCPSRATLMTGLYSHQAGIGEMNSRDTGPGYRGQLDANIPTVAELLRDAGYNTAMVGKWHLTFNKSINAGPNGSWPFQRGFERFFGSMEGAKDYFRPTWVFRNDQPVTRFGENFFYTNAMSQQAADWIREQPSDKPLFVYTAFYAPHFPLQAPADEIARFRGNYRAGWDELRNQRFQKQLAQGIVPPWTRLSGRKGDVPAWETLSPEKQDEMDLRMAIYAAQVSLLDQGVGRILSALRATDRLENTLLIFLSDNGATNVGGALGAGDADLIGTRNAVLKSQYGGGWANLSNTPYREFKADAHEGGVMAPLILHWPKYLGKEQKLRHQPAHIIDLVPTCLDAANAADRRSNAHPALPGRSLLAVTKAEREFFFEHYGSRGVRSGPWKLVNRRKNVEWELYNLTADRVEEHNLSGSNRAKVAELDAAWRTWAQRCNVRAPESFDSRK